MLITFAFSFKKLITFVSSQCGSRGSRAEGGDGDSPTQNDNMGEGIPPCYRFGYDFGAKKVQARRKRWIMYCSIMDAHCSYIARVACLAGSSLTYSHL